MKKYYAIAISFFILALAAAPLLALNHAPAEPPMPQLPTAAVPADPDPDSEPEPQEEKSDNSFRMKLTESGEIIEIPAREYVFGVVAAEMSMLSHDEALKAQAVAAYTYAVYCAAKSQEDFEITDDPSLHQAFLTRAEAMEKWGEKAEEYAARLDSITAATQGLILTYDSAPILAAYHDTSCGRTLPASAVWGGDYPYLISVESAGDLISPSFKKVQAISEADFAEICKKYGISLSGEAQNWVSAPQLDEFGAVRSIKICESEISGADARKIFGLRSAAFDISFSGEEGFKFTTRGYGHGVGMSQTGANYMALCGSPYTEILAWYFPETKLEKH